MYIIKIEKKKGGLDVEASAQMYELAGNVITVGQ